MTRRKKPMVYIGMAADIVHAGHIKIIKTALRYGEVVVGLVSDTAMPEYKRIPCQNYKRRKIVVENIKGVRRVERKNSLDYVADMRRLKPDYVVHGNDWRTGMQKQTRERLINVLKEWGGRLIEVPYTKGISTTQILHQIRRRSEED